jgi:hypothetical protein
MTSARSLGGPQTKTGQGTSKSISRLITKIIHKKKLLVTDKELKEHKLMID